MFATVHNAQLSRRVSPVPHPRALAVDALSLSWEDWWMYMFPPFPILPQVFRKLRDTAHAEAILVAPLWPSQAWFSHLLWLCVELPFALPRHQVCYLSWDDRFHNGDRFNLHAWRLSCITSKQNAFLQRSPDWWQHLDGLLQASSTMSGGRANTVAIRTIPLPLS